MPTHEHALVVGKFAPLHRGHQLLLDVAERDAARLTIIVWSNPDFPDMPNPVRAQWLSLLYPSATVLVADDGPANDMPDGVHRRYVAQLLARHHLTPDVVFTSEAYGPGFAKALGVEHVAVDPARGFVAASGTAIREDPHAHRHLLDARVYAHFVQRVVFLGAESTGKSTLTEAAAREYGTAFVAEYGRTHYEQRGGDLDLDDYVTIAVRHRELEDHSILGARRYLFVDTNAMTTMFFSHYYNRDSLPELRALADECTTRYRHVFVCDDDIVFEQDGWRDNAIWRARMQGMVLHDLAVRKVPYTLVSGDLEARLRTVRGVLDTGTSPSAPTRRVSVGPRPPPPNKNLT